MKIARSSSPSAKMKEHHNGGHHAVDEKLLRYHSLHHLRRRRPRRRTRVWCRSGGRFPIPLGLPPARKKLTWPWGDRPRKPPKSPARRRIPRAALRVDLGRRPPHTPCIIDGIDPDRPGNRRAPWPNTCPLTFWWRASNPVCVDAWVQPSWASTQWPTRGRRLLSSANQHPARGRGARRGKRDLKRSR